MGPQESELFTGWVTSRGLGRVGSGRVGSGRVGSGRVGSGRVESSQGYQTRPVCYGNLLIRPDPTREISNTFRPGFGPRDFRKSPDPARGTNHDP